MVEERMCWVLIVPSGIETLYPLTAAIFLEVLIVPSGIETSKHIPRMGK